MGDKRKTGDLQMEEGSGHKRFVIIAVDDSHTAEHAFDWYMEHLHRPENRLIIIHCVETYIHATPSLFVPVEVYNRELQAALHHAQVLERKYNTRLNAKGAKGSFELVPGKAGDSIVAAATKHHAELIILGTRGSGTLRRTVLGSVSDYVVHHAHCAVVTVRKGVPM